MAGSHKIDQSLSIFDENSIDNEKWIEIKEKQTLNNGLILLPNLYKKRSNGILGNGLLLKGSVCIGRFINENGLLGDELIIEFSGLSTFNYNITQKLQIGEYIIAEVGASIDAFAVIHGPLKYRGLDFNDDGGVHYNGCAFVHDGLNRENNGIAYQEACMDLITTKK